MATQNQSKTHFGEMTMTKTKYEKEQILEEIDTAIYEVPETLIQKLETPCWTFYLHTLI